MNKHNCYIVIQSYQEIGWREVGESTTQKNVMNVLKKSNEGENGSDLKLMIY